MLQPRQKWQCEQPNLQEGDLVLLRSKEVARNMWPLALATKAHESADRKVRKVELMTATDGIKRSYTRPVNEVILLRNEDELNPKPEALENLIKEQTSNTDKQFILISYCYSLYIHSIRTVIRTVITNSYYEQLLRTVITNSYSGL